MKVSLLIADGEDWGQVKEVISEKKSEVVDEPEDVFWEVDEVAEEE